MSQTQKHIGLLVLVLLAVSGQGLAVIASNGESDLAITHQQSQILKTPWKVVRVAVTDPTIADVQVLTPDQVLVQGLAVGTTDIILWKEGESQVMQRRVSVVVDAEAYAGTLAKMFPRSTLNVSQAGGTLFIHGHHRNVIHAQQMRDYLDMSKVNYVDMTDVAGVQQVQLQVRVAEVSKRAIRSLGVNWIQAGNDFSSGVSPGGISSAGAIGGNRSLGHTFDVDNGLVPINDFSKRDFLTTNTISGDSFTAFGILPRADMAFFLEALAENQYLRLLANPTLIALNGEEASFLAGGEYPIPVPQSGTGGAATVTIEYKEYGVRLMFRPTVLGDGTIKLFAAPEVSELDYANGTSVGGTLVPGILARKASTTIELKSGQSFAIAGLLRDSVTSTNSRVPGLGDLPVLGPLFRSVRYQRGETELMILVTANLVEPLDIDAKTSPLPGFLHEAPNDWQLYVNGWQENNQPAKLDAVDAEWLKRLGLDQLNGPGAWDSYGTSAPMSTADEAAVEN